MSLPLGSKATETEGTVSHLLVLSENADSPVCEATGRWGAVVNWRWSAAAAVGGEVQGVGPRGTLERHGGRKTKQSLYETTLKSSYLDFPPNCTHSDITSPNMSDCFSSRSMNY